MFEGWVAHERVFGAVRCLEAGAAIVSLVWMTADGRLADC
jgi:hypothetical protein